MATAAGAYDFQDANLNNMVDVAPVNFENWLASAWNGHLGEGEGS